MKAQIAWWWNNKALAGVECDGLIVETVGHGGLASRPRLS